MYADNYIMYMYHNPYCNVIITSYVHKQTD